jgi:hypothetical protein
MTVLGPSTPLIAGGALPLSAESYVERDHDATCFEQLTGGRWVLLLGPRQQGKTSTLIRLRQRFEESGYLSAITDMQSYAASQDRYSSLLRWFASRLARAAGRTVVEPNEMESDDLNAWLECNIPEEGAVALLVDEVGAVPAEHRIRFFSQLRALYNARAMDDNAVGNRIAFLFSGTFRPERMIETGNSPFNVSVEVHPGDLTLEQTQQLAAVVDADFGGWVDRLFDYVGGQPYLTQRFLEALRTGTSDDERQLLWDRLVQQLQRGEEDRHLNQLFSQVLFEDPLRKIVGAIITGGGVTFSAANEDHLYLQVLGVCRVIEQKLVMRNALYNDTAKGMPQLAELPVPAEETTALVVTRPDSDFSFITDEKLREFCVDSYRSGVNAYQSTDYRAALAAFGATLEAMLLDFLENLHRSQPQQLVAAKNRLAPRERPSGTVASWKFYQLINVACNTTELADARKTLVHQVRDWRNLVHPNVARGEFQEQSRLEPEVRMAIAVCDKVLAELAH